MLKEERSLEDILNYSFKKNLVNSAQKSLWLITSIVAYSLLYRSLIVHYLPYAVILTLLLIPIFSYLLQRSLLLRNKQTSSWLTTIYALIMILIAAVGVTTLEFVAAQMGLDWFTSIGARVSWLSILWPHVYWYLLVGVPGVIVTRFILHLQLR